MTLPEGGADFFIETLHPYFNGPEPVFFNKADFNWAIELENNSERIIENLAPLLDDNSDFNSKLGRIKAEEKYFFPPKIENWKGYYFYYNGLKIKPHLNSFPVIADVLRNIPNLVSANVAILEPGTKILPHRGTTNGFIRCHFGLKIPAQVPDCGFVIAGQEISWQEGKLWMFGDMNLHRAYNNTQKRRYILMLDVVRPEFVRYKKLLCVHQLSKYLCSVTGDYVRKVFHVAPPVLVNDPYNPETQSTKAETRKKKETRGQKITRIMEDRLFPVYKLLFWVVYSFKKLQ